MILRYPSYFEKFSCIADKCPDSCCKEWDVYVDADSAARYIAFPGPLGDDLRRHMQQDAQGDAFFAITDGRCPFWRQDGLCRIQAQCGHEALCKTCREFPRLTHEYGAFTERGLSLSCPAAAELILSAPTIPWVSQEIPGSEAPEYDPLDMDVLLRTREVMLTILVDEHYSIPETLALALLYGYQAQAELDGAEAAPFDAAQELALARSLAKPGNMADILDFYQDLEILTDKWKALLTHPSPSLTWDPALRALARYGVERWWLQAISDFDLVGRVKMVILSCLLVHHLGGKVAETAQLYSKEIENDSDNVDAILDGAYTAPALTDDKLLFLLLEDTLCGNC